MIRFRVAKDGEHLVISDTENGGRPVICFLPNKAKPNAPFHMAEVCAKALNDEVAKYRNERGQ